MPLSPPSPLLAAAAAAIITQASIADEAGQAAAERCCLQLLSQADYDVRIASFGALGGSKDPSDLCAASPRSATSLPLFAFCFAFYVATGTNMYVFATLLYIVARLRQRLSEPSSPQLWGGSSGLPSASSTAAQAAQWVWRRPARRCVETPLRWPECCDLWLNS